MIFLPSLAKADSHQGLTSEEFKMDPLLTGNEVAKILNVSRSQVFILMQRGEIPTIYIGNKNVRVSIQDLEQYIEKNRNKRNKSQQSYNPAAPLTGRPNFNDIFQSNKSQQGFKPAARSTDRPNFNDMFKRKNHVP